ncbi:hypothetical protein PAXRUDRAFT_17370 [Paxillus rubicundulus Ve08.2h10]|uniref:Uncharacterized protein n=1 Tax=Paxillus rubicundulus Ve08.2h10 TaxID=930991 RepID=A0A0D0CQJ2_9AGAM|nr:hypothetical protein PAXRUDRAFT_17370 [Paxillus rubicundulus Ve08.2h10]
MQPYKYPPIVPPFMPPMPPPPIQPQATLPIPPHSDVFYGRAAQQQQQHYVRGVEAGVEEVSKSSKT